VSSLIKSTALRIIAVPDFSKTEKKKIQQLVHLKTAPLMFYFPGVQFEPFPGQFMVQHALLLDEESMPIIKEGDVCVSARDMLVS
jgi:hypothetical protein